MKSQCRIVREQSRHLQEARGKDDGDLDPLVPRHLKSLDGRERQSNNDEINAKSRRRSGDRCCELQTSVLGTRAVGQKNTEEPDAKSPVPQSCHYAANDRGEAHPTPLTEQIEVHDKERRLDAEEGALMDKAPNLFLSYSQSSLLARDGKGSTMIAISSRSSRYLRTLTSQMWVPL